MKQYGVIESCQSCEGGPLIPVLFLGYLPPVNTLRPLQAGAAEETTYPAEMVFCRNCKLAQLRYAVPSEILFPPDYPYTSGTTKILRDNFSELSDEATAVLALEKSSLIVDIGSNDGTLLKNFAQKGHPVAGIEPSLAARLAEAQGIPTVMRFFDARSAADVREKYGIARVVTATNVFAHILDVHTLIKNISALMDVDGVFISESHYLGDLVSTLQYDTIYHEHLRYYSLTSLKHLLERRGLRIFRVKRIPTHGGSIRVYASRSSRYSIDPSVEALLQQEATGGVATEEWIPAFRDKVVRSKLDFYALVASLRAGERRIYGIGAPSRASTLITYLGLDDGILSCVLEVSNSKKLNKFIPGKAIPIVDENRLYQDQPEFALLLSWHIAEELCANLKKRGFKGDFIVPLPSPRIIRHGG